MIHTCTLAVEYVFLVIFSALNIDYDCYRQPPDWSKCTRTQANYDIALYSPSILETTTTIEIATCNCYDDRCQGEIGSPSVYFISINIYICLWLPILWASVFFMRLLFHYTVGWKLVRFELRAHIRSGPHSWTRIVTLNYNYITLKIAIDLMDCSGSPFFYFVLYIRNETTMLTAARQHHGVMIIKIKLSCLDITLEK